MKNSVRDGAKILVGGTRNGSFFGMPLSIFLSFSLTEGLSKYHGRRPHGNLDWLELALGCHDGHLHNERKPQSAEDLRSRPRPSRASGLEHRIKSSSDNETCDAEEQERIIECADVKIVNQYRMNKTNRSTL